MPPNVTKRPVDILVWSNEIIFIIIYRNYLGICYFVKFGIGFKWPGSERVKLMSNHPHSTLGNTAV